MAHSYCHYCGEYYSGLQRQQWPRHCSYCEKDVWKNPLPVAVVMVPIKRRYNSTNHVIEGVLAVRRAIPPDVGGLALISGYVDNEEDWRDAALRELEEEAGITRTTFDIDDLKLFDVVASKNKQHMLVFCEVPPIYMPDSVSNDEVTELVLVKDTRELVWDTHQLMAKRLLKRWNPNVR